ncbi:MAG: lamin tail domain-containing protein [Verrucomicrobiales bacterium]
MNISPLLLPGFLISMLPAQVVINEIHYNSEPNTSHDEFVELYNAGTDPVDVSGWFFQQGINFTIPANTEIQGLSHLVIAQDPAAMQGIYGVDSVGPFGGGLSSAGETVELRQANGTRADIVTYRSEFPWPIGANGNGSSMELIDPSLDNNLGASWRSSLVPGVLPEATLIPASASWSWRKGDSEASSPVDLWRGESFTEDATWNSESMPIGFGSVSGLTFANPIADMRSNYTSVFFRKEFTIARGEISSNLLLRFLSDDGFVVWINGQEVHRYQVNDGDLSIGMTANSNGDESNWIEHLVTTANSFLHEGTNTIAIHAFNKVVTSSDFGINFEVIRPAPVAGAPPVPSPGAANSALTTNAPPAIRQVDHSPNQPAAEEDTVITAKITDPNGVASVSLAVQLVFPGNYVPAFLAKATSALIADPESPRTPNPTYFDAANWITLAMVDDGSGNDALAGDNIYTATVSGQANRVLVRYRISATDSSGANVEVPYADDPALNFAYFVYNGIPDYQADARSVLGAPHTYSAETMTSIPNYHVLTTSANFDQAVAYNGNQIDRNRYAARSAYNWNCSFVYDGKVYDHIGYRLRQRNARYAGNGKRSFKFRFNRGSYPTFRDSDGNKYPEPWKFLATHKMIGSRGHSTWGMDQSTNHKIYNMTGTPAPNTHWFNMRVIRGADEAPNQYQGDHFGMLLALEEFDKRFLDAHGMEKGNLYKLISGRTDGVSVQRYQAADAVDDGSDFKNIIFNLRPAKDDTFLNTYVDYNHWNHYHVVNDMIRHYDVAPNTAEHLKNRAFYFKPMPGNPLGQLQTLPWDSDTSWGPNWNGGIDFPANAIVSGNNIPTREPFATAYKNVVREMRDLIWTPEQISLLLDPSASKLKDLVSADRDRWTGAIGGSQSERDIEPIVADMKKFAFDGGSWVGGTNGAMAPISNDSGVSGQSGRDAYLDALAADPALPAKPTITYSGTAGFPQDELAFTSSAFSDPQGAGSFAAMEWRVAEITPIGGGTEVLMPGGATWTYLDDGSDQGTAWKDMNFDDASWKTGASPAGYGGISGLTLTTAILFGDDNSNKHITTYFRTTINLADPSAFESFTFGLLVDDGAIVYVNGSPVIRDGFNTNTVVNYDTQADSNGGESTFDEFVVDSSFFIAGENVISIEVHQGSLTSSDMGFEMVLSATRNLIEGGEDPLFEWNADWESGALTSFSPSIEVPSITRDGKTYRARVRHEDASGRWSNWSDPVEFLATAPAIQPWLDGLIISEVMYHPNDPTPEELTLDPTLEESDFEWIELMNIGSTPLDLTNVRFTKGIEFDFINSTKMTIAPGERLVVVAKESAFNLRYGFVTTPDFVIGTFYKNLSNGGERLKLSMGAGTSIRDFEYKTDLPWPTVSDGGNRSLVYVVVPDSLLDPTLPESWRAGVSSGGSPGEGESTTFAGDPNGDDDGDGIPNLIAYAAPGGLTLTITEGGYAELSYRRSLAADDVFILIETGNGSWQPTGAGYPLVDEVFYANGTSSLSYRSAAPVNATEIFRLKAFQR